MTDRGSGRAVTGRRVPGYLVLVMSSIAFPSNRGRRGLRHVVLRATRPALNDLRFKGDAEVIAAEGGAAVCLGGYRLTHIACTPLDLPSLHRAFCDLRLGQARWLLSRRNVST